MLLRQILISFGLVLLALPLAAQTPRVTVSSRHMERPAIAKYDWHLGVTATIFWVGEQPTQNNPTPNCKSSWDVNWQRNFGGYDNPSKVHRIGYRPKNFTPRLNPFYVALPYNDVAKGGKHKPEAARVIPWFKAYNPRPGHTVLRGRWVQIARNGRVCYAQWEDCGPFVTDDWQYVFGNKPPKNTRNNNAGIDISPAVRDYMGMKSGQKVHWRFVEHSQVPPGPWSRLGKNNPFVSEEALLAHTTNPRLREYLEQKQRRRQ